MSDWSNGQLGDLIAALDAGVSVNAEDRPHGAGEVGVLKTSAVSGGRFIPQENKTVIEHERRLIAESVLGDSILVSRMNTPALVGESCYVREAYPSLFLPDRLWQLKPKDRAKISMRWLSFVLQSVAYRRHVEIHATGTSGSMKNLPKSKLLELPVSYPTPPEQMEIAEILDTLDTAIHETEAIIAKLKAVKQGLLHDLLTRGIDANGELRPPQTEAPHLYKQSPLGWIPKEWECVRLAEKLGVLGGKRLPAGHAYADHPTAFKYLRVTDFFEREYTLDELENLHQRTFKALDRYEIRSGQLFISIAGSLGYVGVHRSGEGDGIRTILTENAARLVPLERLAPEFVAAYMNSSMVQAQVTAEKGTGGGVPKLALFRIEQFLLGWPDEDEQVQISERLRTVSERIRSELLLLGKLQFEKAGLMDDLLTGRVRVTPLPATQSEGSA